MACLLLYDVCRPRTLVSINLRTYPTCTRTYPTCTRTAQDSAARNGQEFIQKIAELTESMLMDFDQLLTIDDVIKGRTCARHLK